MKSVFVSIVVLYICISPALLLATNHECVDAASTTCLPEDPFSVYECFGGDVGWLETLICPGVCCADDPNVNGLCCCRELDCEVGSRRCFGDDMVKECKEINRGEYHCIEWVPVEWCLETGPYHRCQDAACVAMQPDGDLDGGEDEQTEVDTDTEVGQGDSSDSEIDGDFERHETTDDEEKDQDSMKADDGCQKSGNSNFILMLILLFIASFARYWIACKSDEI